MITMNFMSRCQILNNIMFVGLVFCCDVARVNCLLLIESGDADTAATVRHQGRCVGSR